MWLDRLAIKVAFSELVPPPAPIKRPSSIDRLIQAKAESDQRRYAAKHALLRQMLMSEPQNFEIDSEDRGIVGLTHKSGFRIHIPKTAIPTAVKLKRRQIPQLK